MSINHHIILTASSMLFCALPVLAAEPEQTAATPAPAQTAASTAPARKKTLVVFYSRTGHTKQIAQDLAKLLDADTEQVVDKKDRSGAMGYLVAGKDASGEKLAEIETVKLNPASYDLVVIGTPVWAWNMTPAIRTYITNNKDSLKAVAFFTAAGGTKPDKIIKKLEELSGKTTKASAGFFDKELTEKHKAAYEAKLKAFADKLK